MNNIKYHAIVLAYMYQDDKGTKEINILDQIDSDSQHTNIFDDLEYSLLDQIKIESDDHYFIACIESECIKDAYWEGSEWSVRHEIVSVLNVNNI